MIRSTACATSSGDQSVHKRRTILTRVHRGSTQIARASLEASRGQLCEDPTYTWYAWEFWNRF
jgi:hypothetical protein